MRVVALFFWLSATLAQATVITSGTRTADGFIGNGRTGSAVSFSISTLNSANDTYAYTFSNPMGLDWVVLSLSDNCFAPSGTLLDTGCASGFTGNIASLEFGNFSPDLVLGACGCAADLIGIRGVKINFSSTAQTQSFSFTSDRDVNYLGNFYAMSRGATWFVNSGGSGSLDLAAHLPTPDGGLIGASASPVPEPSSFLFISIPLAALLFIRLHR